MKTIAGANRIENVDVVRQKIVHLARHRDRIDGLVDTKMRDLPGRVNAGICPPGAADVDVAEQLARHFDQPALNGLRRVTLRLPTGVASSLVLDRQFVSRHALNDELGTVNDEQRPCRSSFIVHRSSLYSS